MVEQWDDPDSHVEELIALTGDYRVARVLHLRRQSSEGLGASWARARFTTEERGSWAVPNEHGRRQRPGAMGPTEADALTLCF